LISPKEQPTTLSSRRPFRLLPSSRSPGTLSAVRVIPKVPRVWYTAGVKERILFVFAKKYLWWQEPEEAVRNPERVLAAAMNSGSIDDYQTLYRVFGPRALASVLQLNVPGWFSAKSWSLWHRVLDLVPTSEPVPPPPVRSFR
jgi:hypothetical protein